MERRLKMMIAGSIAVWVPVSSAAQVRQAPIDMDKAFRLKAQAAGGAPVDVR